MKDEQYTREIRIELAVCRIANELGMLQGLISSSEHAADVLKRELDKLAKEDEDERGELLAKAISLGVSCVSGWKEFQWWAPK